MRVMVQSGTFYGPPCIQYTRYTKYTLHDMHDRLPVEDKQVDITDNTFNTTGLIQNRKCNVTIIKHCRLAKATSLFGKQRRMIGV